MRALCLWIGLATLLSACGPSEKDKARIAEEEGHRCLDELCAGDVTPKHDSLKEFVFKTNGNWFIAPSSYGGYGGSLAFFWPSKTPAQLEGAVASAPEFVPRGSDGTSNFYDVGIEIFLRSNNFPPEPRGYKLMELAEKNDWIAERRQLRPGLQSIRMQGGVIGPSGYHIDDVTYYVATELRGVDGLPPVATCNNSRSDGGGGSGFMWQPGIWVGIRMNQKHCADWPDIYLEVLRVLNLIRKA